MKLIVLLLVIFPAISLAKNNNYGIQFLGKPRLYMYSSDKNMEVRVSNVGVKDVLVQPWVQNQSGEMVDDFIISPAIFEVRVGGEREFLIINNRASDSPTIEVQYRLITKVVPKVERVKGAANLATSFSYNKPLFYRPDSLDKSDAYKQVVGVTSATGKLYLRNPTPYFIPVYHLYINGEKFDVMDYLKPFGGIEVDHLVKNNNLPVSIGTVTDVGHYTKKKIDIVKEDLSATEPPFFDTLKRSKATRSLVLTTYHDARTVLYAPLTLGYR